jgi:hypothetical protein
MPERCPAGDPERVFIPVLTMAVAQFFDFGTFVAMIRRHGPDAEANPLVAAILTDLGVPAAALVKAALVLLVASIVVILSGSPGTVGRRRLAALILGLAVLAGLVGGCTNALTLGPI